MTITLHWYHGLLIQLWAGVYYALRVTLDVRIYEKPAGGNFAIYCGAMLLTASAIVMSVFLLFGGNM